MFQSILEWLNDKNRRMEDDFTIKDLNFLFDQIIFHAHFEISRGEIRRTLEEAILSYDWNDDLFNRP